MLAIFQGLFGPAGIALYKGLDFLFDIDEPQIGDLLPPPSNYDDYNNGDLSRNMHSSGDQHRHSRWCCQGYQCCQQGFKNFTINRP